MSTSPGIGGTSLGHLAGTVLSGPEKRERPYLLHVHFPRCSLNGLRRSRKSEFVPCPIKIEYLIPTRHDSLVVLAVAQWLGLEEGQASFCQLGLELVSFRHRFRQIPIVQDVMPEVEIGQEDIRIATFKLNPDSAFALGEMTPSPKIRSGTSGILPLQPCPYRVCPFTGWRANTFPHLVDNPPVGRRQGLLRDPVSGSPKYTGRPELSPRLLRLDCPEDHSRWYRQRFLVAGLWCRSQGWHYQSSQHQIALAYADSA